MSNAVQTEDVQSAAAVVQAADDATSPLAVLLRIIACCGLLVTVLSFAGAVEDHETVDSLVGGSGADIELVPLCYSQHRTESPNHLRPIEAMTNRI
jgi:hypothetical protein